jgi:hypothetical protein
VNELDYLRALGSEEAPDARARALARAALRTRIASPEKRLGTSRRRLASRWNSGLLVVGGSVAVVLAVVAIVVLAGRGDGSPTTPDRPAPSLPARIPPAERPLARILGPLRRPQTATDRDPALLRQLAVNPRIPTEVLDGTPIASSLRLATTTPWGAKVRLLLLRPPTRAQLEKLPADYRAGGLRALARQGNADTLAIQLDNGGGTTGVTAPLLAAHGDITVSSPAHPPARMVLVVPDGISKITELFPRYGTPGTPSYRRALSVTASVHNNVAAFTVNQPTSPIAHTIWYDHNGHALKQFDTPY